ncbi:hypothetical protein AKJ59_00200 [candidate division MSBL1 archaeon SCGC-AAA385M02]|uniref:Uncharacterized protein n=1 Tax=candidate division MSBL1 archaeon SCGC-AAA385M02 TaxID=1698287 RepID=A0A133VR71_9EURY|nr:hypothetical protein AKJ59_00200 [candidate division MSBL1 archaeon SCGC-AAA385M02]
MGRNKPGVPKNVPVNEKRGKAKARRNKGLLAMGETDAISWTQSHDPLFKVKGKERATRT